MARSYDRGTSTGDPRFLPPQYIARCPDCDLNGFLRADGRRDLKKKHLIERCSTCGGRGKIHYITRDLLRENPDRARHLHEVGWYFVSRKDTLDPYMLDVPKSGPPMLDVPPRNGGVATTSGDTPERPCNAPGADASASEGDSSSGG